MRAARRWRLGDDEKTNERREAFRCWLTFGSVFFMTALVSSLGAFVGTFSGASAIDSSSLETLSSELNARRRLNATEKLCYSSVVSDPLQLQDSATSIFYIVAVCFMFVSIHILCENHFVPILEAITSQTSLSPDVVGATLMAAGSSAPELFASLMGVVFQEARDVGVGTVVGSTVFNMLIIIGVSVLVSPGSKIHVSGRSMFRDGFFYVLSLIMLISVIGDGTLSVAEAAVMVLLYVVYIVALVNWSILRNHLIPSCLRCMRCPVPDAFGSPPLGKFHDLETAGGDGSGNDGISDEETVPPVSAITSMANEEEEKTPEKSSTTAAAEEVTERTEVRETEGNGWTTCMERAVAIAGKVTYPIKTCFRYTVVPLRNSPGAATSKIRLISSFICCLVWLFVLVFMMIEWADKVGCLLNVSESVMGLTVTSIGTSAPDAIASFITARKDKDGGKMAISNVFGSNIFDILFALGLPVLLFSGEGIPLDLTENLPSVVILFVVLLMLIIILITSRPQMTLNRWAGWLHVGLYGAYILFVIIDDAVTARV